MKLIVTGGCGFIGSNLILHLMSHTEHEVVNIDKLTYASNPEALAGLDGSSRYRLEKEDIADATALRRIFTDFAPDAVLHLAAESNVDRSISSPEAFIQTNLTGTYRLLECAREYWTETRAGDPRAFGFYHVSTDEVFGDLGDKPGAFTEQSPYAPSSPYSASKAGADHLVRSWQRTWGLPATICHPSNNYGPWQLPDKLIPRMIHSALSGKPMPIYGNGRHVRDWLHVQDHARALAALLDVQPGGKSYVIGSRNEQSNLQVVAAICECLDEMAPPGERAATRHLNSYRELIHHVTDRPGHDSRYAVNPERIESELGWKAQRGFADGLRETVGWYLENRQWCQRMDSRIQSGDD